MSLPKGLTVEGIKKRFALAEERRSMWRSPLQDMYDFTIPNRETFNFHSPGQRKARHIFDSTAPESVNTFVSEITGSTTPEAAKWMKYEAGSDIPDGEKKDANKALEDATETFFKYMSHSDFGSQVNISHQDMSISTGCLLVEQGNDIDEPLLKFTAVPLAELYLEPTSLPKIHTAFRKHTMKAQEVMIKYPEAKLSAKKKKFIEDEPTSDVEIIDGSQVFNFEDKTYHQVVLWGDEDIFNQSYGKSAPAIIYRWSKVAGETYGRGPVDMAMADIRTVNKVKEYTLKNAALILSPPMMGASDGIFNPHTARVHPGSIMAVTSTDPAPLVPLQVGGDLRVGQFVIEDLQANIRKILFADAVGDLNDPVQSATFNMIRQQEMLKKRGANFGRIRSEFIFPLVDRITQILVDAGKIPPIKVDGRDVTLKMSSPLASAEQQTNVDNVLLYMNAMEALPEQVKLLGASLESVPAFLVENLNLPEKLARSEEQIKQGQEILLQQAQAQAEGPQQQEGDINAG